MENIGGRLGRAVKEDQYVRERIEDGGSDASDYSTVFLPWSPNWNAEAIRKLMYTKDMVRLFLAGNFLIRICFPIVLEILCLVDQKKFWRENLCLFFRS